MTLTVYNELEQGSDEWLAARCGILTASQVHKLITATGKIADNETSRGLTEALVAERITGIVEYVNPTFDMQRGSMDEPYARDMYAEHYSGDDGPVIEVGFATLEVNGHNLGASPDALVGDRGGLEIKAPKAKNHLRTILSGSVPAEHMAQIQTSMLVLGREWWDFCSYSGGWPLYVQRVYADPAWFELIREAHAQFEVNAARMIDAYTAATIGDPIAPVIDHYLDVELKL